MTANMTYDALYKSLKDSFTVVKENEEYTLGAYLLKKAKEKKESGILPITATSTQMTPLRAFAGYVADKLTVKSTPAPEKTLRAFPLRTSLAALCSAVLLCTLVFSVGFMNRAALPETDLVAEYTSNEQTTEQSPEVQAS